MVDLKKWMTDQLRRAGKSDAEIAAALAAFDERTLTAAPFAEQSELDQLRSRHQLEIQEYDTANREWQDAFFQELGALGAVETLRRYRFDVSGLQNAPGGGVRDRNTGQQFTPQQLLAEVRNLVKAELEPVAQRIEAIRTGAIDYSSFITRVAPWYERTYKKQFDTPKFLAFAKEPENLRKYPDFDSAFDAFTTAEREEKQRADAVAREAEIRTDERKRVMSERSMVDPMAPGSVGRPGVFANSRTAPGQQQQQSPAAPPQQQTPPPPPPAAPPVKPFSYSLQPGADTPVAANLRDRLPDEARQRIGQKYEGADFGRGASA